MLGIRSRTIKGVRRLSALWNSRSDLERMVAVHRGHVINKWEHFYEVYDRHFARYRDQDITILEVGISGGGSLQLWRTYFGPKARIFGIDIDPNCKRFEAPGTRVFIGDQGDAAFLEQVVSETGPLDILIDDGSHAHHHQLATFRALFPHIKDDGIYCCEDLFSSYLPEPYGGGLRKPGTYVEFLKDMIDELNAWFWREGVENTSDAFANVVHGMHFYPTLLVVEKRRMKRPLVTPVGHTPMVERPLTPAPV